MSDGNTSARALQDAYTAAARRIAQQLMSLVAHTPLTPNALTATGVSLCLAGSVLVVFESHRHLYYWLGAAVFLLGSVLDILDGALARAGGKGTEFGAFIDSTTDRMGEAAMLGGIGLIFSRHGNTTALAFCFAAIAGSFLVSYARSKAEMLGLKGAVGIGQRAERVVLIVIGLVFAPWGALQWAVYALAAMVWFTVLQRIVSVRSQLRARG